MSKVIKVKTEYDAQLPIAFIELIKYGRMLNHSNKLLSDYALALINMLKAVNQQGEDSTKTWLPDMIEETCGFFKMLQEDDERFGKPSDSRIWRVHKFYYAKVEIIKGDE